ncbi:ribose-5-phosphate isomerase RpiA [Candidatus Bathyarchaeota archaeon]|nr:MAG: ribose-5-phosphate isomerase RpiA [Candidatus Bathyarchaeota archaeon]RLI19225.1 MAG: ribose 5-phosphate isomerase A [Candidatus Bathyarchaeota archaeon]
MKPLTWVEDAKRRAAEEAVKHVEDGQVIGLGSGSTAAYAIRLLGERLRGGELRDILGIPTSLQAASEAVEAGIPLTTLEEHPIVDVSIDGADQLDARLNLIKGGGGALLREKIVASCSKLYIIVADERKLARRLGENCPIPLEVHPMAVKPIMRRLEELGARASLRMARGKVGPVVTDNGNLIIDADFGPVEDPEELDGRLRMIPGVLETGLFLGYADLAYIGTRSGLRRIEGQRRR